jgi:hypothetical protein
MVSYVRGLMSTVVPAPAVSAQPIQVEKFVKRFGATTALNGVSHSYGGLQIALAV